MFFSLKHLQKLALCCSWAKR